NNTGKIVIKNSTGQAGKEILIIETDGLTYDLLTKTMHSGNYDLAEEYIIQHPTMIKLSPSGVNTVRLITMVTDGTTDILGARLRISINSPVDNLAAGNAAAPMDPLTGIVTGNAVFSDITKPDIKYHPVTGVKIPGFQVPFWPEIIDMVKKASVMAVNNRSVGWDIAITPSGPLLIEGNHNWCKLLWQLPVKKGLKNELERYL
ncbi:MAG: hexapeptide transferase, partial [Bacteroidales bacterium]|nr:hexapeptide transferase [Bacteroidales bacterium]